MGKKKVNSGCIYIEYIYIKFSKVRLLKIILAPLALYLTLKAVICNPVTLQQVLCIPAFPAQDLLLSCSSGCVELTLPDKFQWPHFASPAAWGCSETPGYILTCEMLFVIFKNYLQTRKRGSTQQKGQETQRFCEMWPRSLQSVGLVTVSINVLWQLLLFMPGFKAWEKEAVRDSLGSQTGSVRWALKHLPKCGGHWRAVQD